MRLRFGCVVIALLVTFMMNSGVNPVRADDEVPSEAAAKLELVDELTPYDLDREADISYDESLAVYSQEGLELSVDTEPKGGEVQVEIADEESGNLALGVSGLGLQKGKAMEDGVVFDSVQEPVSLTIQPGGGGVQISFVIENSSAPSVYDFDFDLESGDRLDLDSETGWVVWRDSEGLPKMHIAAPWAKDANGVSVPTRYVIEGGKLAQVVEHSSKFAYPIVADPFAGKDLIKSAVWRWIPRTRSFGAGWTLKITATEWAWEMSGAGYADFVAHASRAGWDELLAKSRQSGGFITFHENGYPRGTRKKLDRYLGAMRNQYLCHAEYAAGYYKNRRPTWNLDEWRKDVPYGAVIRYKCNPPAGGPYRS